MNIGVHVRGSGGDAAARTDFNQRFAILIAPVLPSMTIKPIDSADGTTRSLVYLVREERQFVPFAS